MGTFLEVDAGDSWSIGIVAPAPLLVFPTPGDSVPPLVPERFGIRAVVPNPFNPQTTVWLEMARPGQVSVTVLDVRGRRVRRLFSGPLSVGRHAFVWDGRDDRSGSVGAGTYVIAARAEDGLVRAAKVSIVK